MFESEVCSLKTVLFRETHSPLLSRGFLNIEPKRVNFKSGGTLVVVWPRASRGWKYDTFLEVLVVCYAGKALTFNVKIELQFEGNRIIYQSIPRIPEKTH